MQSFDAPFSSLSLSQTSSDNPFGVRNPALLCTDIADCWLRNEYSFRLIVTNLEQVTLWNAILFHLLYGSSIYRPVCLFLSIELSWIYKPSGVCQRGFSPSAELWEIHYLTLQPLITDIYLCGRINVSCLSYFSNLPWIEQKLNWNVTQAFEKI